MTFFARYPDKHFTPCPEGVHHACCVDVVDLGEVDTAYGRKPRVRLAWQIDEIDPATQRRFDVIATYTNSLFKTANLRKDLEAWRGRKLTEDEAKQFDLDTLLGVNAMLHIVHNVGEDGTTYANVRAIMPPAKGAPKLAPLNYTRHQDRTQTGATPTRATSTWPTKPTRTPTLPDALDATADDDIAVAFSQNTAEVRS